LPRWPDIPTPSGFLISWLPDQPLPASMKPVPGRGRNVLDVGIDTLGASAAES
jgi:hypothetical protein